MCPGTVSRSAASAHMWCMDQLLADLRKLAARHRRTSNEEVQDLLLDLSIILDDAPAPEYEYRNHTSWDTTWMELDPAQIATVLEHGHTVERRLIHSTWENVTEVPA